MRTSKAHVDIERLILEGTTVPRRAELAEAIGSELLRDLQDSPQRSADEVANAVRRAVASALRAREQEVDSNGA